MSSLPEPFGQALGLLSRESAGANSPVSQASSAHLVLCPPTMSVFLPLFSVFTTLVSNILRSFLEGVGRVLSRARKLGKRRLV